MSNSSSLFISWVFVSEWKEFTFKLYLRSSNPKQMFSYLHNRALEWTARLQCHLREGWGQVMSTARVVIWKAKRQFRTSFKCHKFLFWQWQQLICTLDVVFANSLTNTFVYLKKQTIILHLVIKKWTEHVLYVLLAHPGKHEVKGYNFITMNYELFFANFAHVMQTLQVQCVFI